MDKAENGATPTSLLKVVPYSTHASDAWIASLQVRRYDSLCPREVGGGGAAGGEGEEQWLCAGQAVLHLSREPRALCPAEPAAGEYVT